MRLPDVPKTRETNVKIRGRVRERSGNIILLRSRVVQASCRGSRSIEPTSGCLIARVPPILRQDKRSIVQYSHLKREIRPKFV